MFLILQTLELSVNYSDGVHSFNSTAVLALSALTKDEVNANRVCIIHRFKEFISKIIVK